MSKTGTNDLDPKLFTDKSLEELRREQTKKEAPKAPPTKAEIEYARTLWKEHKPDGPIGDLDIALQSFQRDYVQRSAKAPTPSPMHYADARILLWETLTHLMPDGTKYEIEPINQPVYQNLLKYFLCDPSSEYDLKKGIYLFGDVGRGKSFLMKAIQMVMRVIKFEARQFTRESCRDIVFRVGETKEINVLRTFFDGPYCFDDFGYEDKTAKVWGQDHSIMEEILVQRYDKMVNYGLMTHITSNLPPEKVKDVYGSARLSSRFYEMFNFMHLEGIDKRKSINR